MPINRYLQIMRYKQIVMVFVRHGFGILLDRVGILEYLKISRRIIKKSQSDYVEKYSVGERLRLAFEELGPTFIKLGQFLSTRTDLFSDEIIHELEKLQSSAPPFSANEAKSIIEAEFSEKLEKLFCEFEENPMAAASIAQVHKAKLLDGKEVVVKVQRPGIEKDIMSDVRILEDIAQFVDSRLPEAKYYNFKNMVSEFNKTLKEELDFTKEAENIDVFSENIRKDKGVYVPKVIWSYTSRRVLTMEYIDGIPINDIDRLTSESMDPKKLIRVLAESILNQILRDGFFHADPHPGNILVLKNGSIVFLDLGMVGKLSERRKEMFSHIFMGIAFNNARLIVQAMIDLDTMSHRVSIKKIEKEVEKLLDKYLNLPLKELKIGHLIREIFNVAISYKITLPGDIFMITKSILTLEGLIEKIDPSVSVLYIAKPIAKKMLYRMYSVEKLGKDIWRGLMDYNLFLKELPSFIFNFLRKFEDDDFAIQFDLKNMDNVQKWINKIFNRLSFSIVLLALSIILAGIIIGSGLSADTGGDLYYFNFNVLRIGLMIVGLMMIGLIISILRTGRF